MHLQEFRIENFRRFRFVEVEIPDGVLALVGRNGAGKSTLLEAIGWCLYGNEAARTSKDLIKRRGCAPGDDVRVRLVFDLAGHVYEVTRELLGKSEAHSASVLVDGKVAVPAGASSGREATGFIERLFHMDRAAFFTSLVARQRELSALTDAKPAERKRLLIGLLRLDAVDAAILAGREKKRDARAELVGLRRALVDPQVLEAQLAAARAAMAQVDADAAALGARIATLEAEVEDAKTRREAARARAEEHRVATHALQQARERVAHTLRERERRATELAQARAALDEAAQLAKELELLPAAQALAERLASLRVRHEELVRAKGELARAEADLARADAEGRAAAALLAGGPLVHAEATRLAAERSRLDGILGEALRGGATAASEMREREKQLREVQAKVAKVHDLGPDAACPTCTRPLGEHHGELLHGLGAEADALRISLDDVRGRAAAAARADAETRALLVELTAREGQVRIQRESLARAEAALAAARQLFAEATARAERLRAHAKALESEPYDAPAHQRALVELRRLEGVAARHARALALGERAGGLAQSLEEGLIAEREAAAREAGVVARLAALAFDPAAYAALEKLASSAESRLLEARLARERLHGERLRRVEEEARASADIARQADLAARASALERRVLLLEQLTGDRDAGLLPEFKDHVIGRIRPMLSAHAGRLFRELTEGRYADLEVAEDYDLRVRDDGEAFALERFSGGEGDLANLCLRLAVSQVVAQRAGTEGFGFLALDEVFGSQDEVRKGNILRTLKGLSGRFRQIVLITHIDDVKDAAEHVLRVRALEDGTSEVVVESA